MDDLDRGGMRAAARFCTSAVTYGLADLGPELGQARSLDDLSPLPRAIVGALLSADVLIVGSPVYKAATRDFLNTCLT